MNFQKLMTAAPAVAMLLSAPAYAQAGDAYMGEVLITGGNYCPRTSLELSGQLLSIAQNQALFSLFGTTYGGDGITTFKLPDQRGRVALHTGQGPGLGTYALGQTGGVETTTLNLAQLPRHLHTGNLVAAGAAPNIDNPTGAALADFPPPNNIYNNSVTVNTNMATGSVVLAPAGGNQPFSNLSPYVTVRVCVFTQGIYPSRS